MTVAGLPANASRVLLRHFRIGDHDHSNAFALHGSKWARRKLLHPEQYARLEAAGKLELLEPPRWVSTRNNRVELEFRCRATRFRSSKWDGKG